MRILPMALAAACAAVFTSALAFPGETDATAALELPAAPQGKDPDKAETCGGCHTEIYEEWKGRAHAKAWVDPVYQAAIKLKKRPQLCHNCHIPQSVLDRLGKKPRTRSTHHDEGVTCVACHRQGEAIHGPYGSQTDAHPSVKNEAFSEQGAIELCASCHAVKIADVLPVAKDFMRAGLDKKGMSCTKCHMPEVERHVAISPATGRPTGEKRMGRRHIVLGPSDAEFCGKAFEFAAEKGSEGVTVKLVNKAGHGVPGLRLRTFPISFRLLGPEDKLLHEGSLEISSDNQLKAEETRTIELPWQEGAAAVEVRVDHVFQGKKVATVVQQRLPLE